MHHINKIARSNSAKQKEPYLFGVRWGNRQAVAHTNKGGESMTDEEFINNIKALIFDYAMSNAKENVTCGDWQSIIKQIEELVKK